MAGMNEKDYYAVLGVDKDATTDQIRKAFQQKARKLHPDVNKEPDAEERFKEVSEAYAVLSDDEKRRRYDAMRSGVPFAGSGGYAGAQGGYAGSNPYGWGFPFGAYGTSRRPGSSQQSRSYNPKAGADVTVSVTLDEKAAHEGTKRGLTYQRFASCEKCHGSGSVHSEHPETCPTCKGRGRISVDMSDFLFGVMEMTCPECQGSGKVVADPCSACGGAGRVLTASEVVVEIPEGSHDGDVVRIPGMGNAGTNGEAAGDFVCQVSVPTEQLSPQARFAYRSLGVFLPFLALYAMYNLQAILITLGVALGAIILIGVMSGGIGKGRYWWRNAMRDFLAGMLSSLPIALFFMLFRACNAMMFYPMR